MFIFKNVWLAILKELILAAFVLHPNSLISVISNTILKVVLPSLNLNPGVATELLHDIYFNTNLMDTVHFVSICLSACKTVNSRTTTISYILNEISNTHINQTMKYLHLIILRSYLIKLVVHFLL